MDFYSLKSDGSCGPKNPGGTAAFGFVLSKNGVEVERGSGVIGSGPTMSNNLAEWYAMGEGFKCFLKHYDADPKPNAFLSIRADSQLVIKQLRKKWNADPSKLYYPSYQKAIYYFGEIKNRKVRVSIEWVPREQNQLCDELSKAYKKHNNLPK